MNANTMNANTMNDITTAPPDAPTNLVVLRGEVRGSLTRRELAAGAVVVQFDVSTAIVEGERSQTTSVPVVWGDPSDAAVATMTDGTVVVVVGTVRRRFFRVGGATQSRTEVIADSVIPARRHKQVARALEDVAERLAG